MLVTLSCYELACLSGITEIVIEQKVLKTVIILVILNLTNENVKKIDKIIWQDC